MMRLHKFQGVKIAVQWKLVHNSPALVVMISIKVEYAISL